MNDTGGDALSRDIEARREALDPARSFIVQAPAGSGKTELLTQRYLALLASARRPEEVVAITFTRKAASEMRRRIIESLQRSRDEPRPGESHQRTTWELGERVLARDREMGWQLLDDPGRLTVQTIDSLCSWLAHQMPILSRSGSSPRIAERVEPMYQHAARITFAAIDHDDEEVAANVEWLLSHLDNRLDTAIDLLADMLRTRDHWLPRIAGQSQAALSRSRLEKTLAGIVREALAELAASLPASVWDELAAVARIAAANLEARGDPSPIVACRVLDGPPDDPDDPAAWQGLAALLLTDKNALRRKTDVRTGFPPAGKGDASEVARRKHDKERAAALLEQLADEPAFVHRLAAIRSLPSTAYDDGQWRTLQALISVLPRAAAELKLVFRAAGEMDFTEVAHSALQALGTPEAPTDLALSLDYRISHVLVDEFQDTSRTQFALLEMLTAGWQRDDGRTLFLVGDPMQSIYRFREADVGLFLRARAEGLGDVALEPLVLSRNFRSDAGVVDWVNTVFDASFPDTEDAVDGAVTYSPAVPARAAAEQDAVAVHAFPKGDGPAEARAVVALVAQAHREQPLGSIAVLVRSRTHLAVIAPALRDAGLKFRAVEIETLGHRQAVKDVHALTLALSHLAHRPAWLAILRAPWCGLTLADLHALVAEPTGRTVWECIVDPQVCDGLSADGRQRLARLKRALAKSLADRGRESVRTLVEAAWRALGGRACLTDPADPDNVRAYFDLLDSFDDGGRLNGLARFEQELKRLYARPDPSADANVELMTIHKAKGLEFDTVILPGLARSPAHSDERLLQWLDHEAADGERRLVVAPIRPAGGTDPILRYLKRIDAQRDTNEQLRLLYVAATRARHRLHLLAGVAQPTGAGLVASPTRTSLLARVWRTVRDEFALAADAVAGTDAPPDTPAVTPLRHVRRLPSDWMPPEPPAPQPWRPSPLADVQDPEVTFVWASETARQVGNVVHRTMQEIARHGPDAWSARWLAHLEPHLRRMLGMRGVPAAELDEAASRATQAVLNTLSDERGRWILDPGHRDARAEMPLTGWVEERMLNVVIDRSFVDSQGTRWIIDFKTGSHEGGTVDGFLDNEVQRYRGQLETYAYLMRRLDPSPVRVALYFPMLQGWREWQP